MCSAGHNLRMIMAKLRALGTQIGITTHTLISAAPVSMASFDVIRT